jgi:hypothetical protein
MTSNKQEMDNVNTTKAGVLGAVVGAGLAVATVKVLSDQNTRKKAVEKIGAVKDHMIDSIHYAQRNSKKIKSELEGGKKAIEKVAKK